jgi:hypothetical protein
MFKKIIISFLIFFSCILLAQFNKIEHSNAYSEGDFYLYKDKLYSDAIVIKFNEHVIKTPLGKKGIIIPEIDARYVKLHKILSSLNNEFGPLGIEKQIPDSEWGENTVRHRITKRFVRIHDYSQLITLKFKNPTPLDSLIELFCNLPEVDYVHQPIIYVSLEEPDDDYYENNGNGI